MGQCGRGNDDTNTINVFELTFTIDNYVYLVERLYQTDNDDLQKDVTSDKNSSLVSSRFFPVPPRSDLVMSQIKILPNVNTEI